MRRIAFPVVLALVLAGCAGENSDSGDDRSQLATPTAAAPSPSPEAEPIVLGAEWSWWGDFTPPGEMAVTGAISAGGAIWVSSDEGLYWTSDGQVWSTLSRDDAGLPDRVRMTASTGKETPQGVEFFAFHEQYPQYWTVTVTPEGEVTTVQVADGLGEGVRGGPEGTDLYVGIPVERLSLHDRELMVAVGRWIVPFSSSYPMVSIVDTTEEWELLVDGSSPLRSRTTYAAGASAVAASDGDTIVVIVRPNNLAERSASTTAHSSVDGREWTTVELTNNRTDSLPDIISVVAGDHGFVALGSESDENGYVGAATWRSADGIEWEYAALPDIGDAEPVQVLWTGEHYVALGRVDRESRQLATWRSEDGVTWDAVPADIESVYRPPRYLLHEGALVLISALDFYVSGPWPEDGVEN